MVTLESLVPCNHIIRENDATIDFSFVYDLHVGKYMNEKLVGAFIVINLTYINVRIVGELIVTI